ncbi:DNA polymerase beta superfamily protein [Emergencia timonensis]
MQLLYKSNPMIFEWCASPIVYRSSPEFESRNRFSHTISQ